MLLQIQGITTKMRNKIRMHGYTWRAGPTPPANLGERIMISTLQPVHAGGKPYSIWVMIGKDIDVLEVTDEQEDKGKTT